MVRRSAPVAEPGRCSAWALTAELTIFLVTNLVTSVAPVLMSSKLDSVPATSSFPSGHVAATFALYGSLALIVTLRDSTSPSRAVLLWVWAAFATAAVAFARVYRGAHHVSDVSPAPRSASCA